MKNSDTRSEEVKDCDVAIKNRQFGPSHVLLELKPKSSLRIEIENLRHNLNSARD